MSDIQRNKTRLTGILYLLVIICAGFSQGYVRGSLVVFGDAAETIENISSALGLFRVGLATDLVAFLLDVAISVLLYQLLKSVNQTLAMVSSAFRLIAHPAIGSLNLLNHYMVLEVLGGNMDPVQQEIWTMLFLNAHNYGYLLAGAFFGVHCFLLGILLYRSHLFSSVFGILMMVASLGYLLESFGDFLYPGNEYLLANVVGFTAGIAEVSFTIYLLIKKE
ncbi:MAG: DUF4386 domain-containing protein [Reichenbachiella sp.]|uniref:DUF4386 domain-containing protein n=1 Tax=Reichenbachiella sp. TaxID=2184521 RepID=UPI0032986C98